MNAFNLLGLMSGPALNFGIDRLHRHLGFLQINHLTTPGLIIMTLELCCLVGLVCIYEEPPHIPHSPTSSSPSLSPHTDHVWTMMSQTLFERAAIACWGITFTNNFLLSALETALTPITQSQYGWGTLQNSLLFCGIAVVAVSAIFTTAMLSKHTEDRILILTAFGIELTALLLMVLLCSGDKVPLWCILLASGVLMFGIPLQGSPNSALYSKLVPQAHQGYSH
eukprot:TRINITY_DN8330_c0_g2_i2.p1 TRINITY_DN8330_c0_g2~~TRINITY_DN8330_c0_g2_i2.p1  ORF type:complete len:224 (-),score=10.67 TRINITY_DN8330_c0_g2_i2:71-742(-)